MPYHTCPITCVPSHKRLSQAIHAALEYSSRICSEMRWNRGPQALLLHAIQIDTRDGNRLIAGAGIFGITDLLGRRLRLAARVRGAKTITFLIGHSRVV